MPSFPPREPPAFGRGLSRALKAVRRHRGLTAADTAAAMGMPLRSFEHFEAGRGRPNLQRIWAFAAALDADPFAILAAMLLERPELAVHAADNKLGLALLMALDDFSDDAGERLARLEPRTIIAAFDQAFAALQTAAQRPDDASDDPDGAG